jgi:surface carbohydrate biosynthesis protein (TIGR04326 family)
MELNIYDQYDHNTRCLESAIYWESEAFIENSLDTILNKNKLKIKRKYLEVIDSIIKKNENYYSYFSFLGINLLELSLINEKNPYKSKNIYNSLKLLALEDFIINNRIKKINYFGSQKNICLSIKDLCWNLKVQYKKEFILEFNKIKLVYFLEGIYLFIFFILKNFKKHKLKKINSNISFFSYFLHFKNKESKTYNSILWDRLNEVLRSLNIKSNWFHFFVPSSQIKNIKNANTKINIFNNNKFENHTLINSFINFNYLLEILYKYCLFFFKSIIFINTNNFFLNKCCKSNFFYFFQKDLNRSIYGDVLIYNLFNIVTINKILKEIPKQKIGFYILENQSWEICLIKLWRKYNHGKLVGYINSSIRFWDLRYFKSKQLYLDKNYNPDLYFFNSKQFMDVATNNYYPKKKSKIVEALRYIHLTKKICKQNYNKKILILGDINEEENYYIFSRISNIYSSLKEYKFYFRPHPANSLKTLNKLKFQYPYIFFLKNRSVFDTSKFSNVICSNGTSAIMDCIILKLKFFTIKAQNSLDLFAIDNNIWKEKQLTHDDEIISFIKNPPKKIKEKFTLNLSKNLVEWSRFIKLNYYKL